MRRLLVSLFAASVAAACVAACGARTPLGVEDSNQARSAGATGSGGAGGVGGMGGAIGAGGCLILDGGLPDVPIDEGPDVAPDVPVPTDCIEAGVTYIYVITAKNTLWSFYPPTAAFSPIGTIACPGEPNAPFSMGVDRQGIAWVVFQGSGKLYRVDTATAGCTSTPYVANQLGWSTFGMAFARLQNSTADALFVAESSYQHPSKGLGAIDLQTFQLHPLAPLALPPPPSFAIELTGTGDGRLFGFSLDQPGPVGSHVSQIDETTAFVSSSLAVPSVGTPSASFAFAYWGGAFYLFTALGDASPTTVTRFDPTTMSAAPVAMLSDAVVGVGVSTCAPE